MNKIGKLTVKLLLSTTLVGEGRCAKALARKQEAASLASTARPDPAPAPSRYAYSAYNAATTRD